MRDVNAHVLEVVDPRPPDDNRLLRQGKLFRLVDI